MMSTLEYALRALALVMIVSAAGCSGDRLGERFSDFGWPPGQSKEKAQPITISMAGRWTLSSTNRGQCGMNFSGAPKVTEGTIAPEGGCPGSFYTSRRWSIEDGQVIIRDHNGEQLVKLEPSGGTSGASMTWFSGLTATGERVMLAR